MSGDDWLLTYPGAAFRFGSLTSGYGFKDAPDVGVLGMIAGDVVIDGQDGRQFGADAVDTSVITFVMDVVAAHENAARDLVSRARQAWRADSIRTIPGAVATLTSENGRTTFGRPRRFEAPNDSIYAGVARITADFSPVTDLWFGDTQSVQVHLVPAPGGGLVAPLTSPLATTESSDRSQAVMVDGELPTWPSVTIFGPITNPVVELGPIRWELLTALAYDQSVTINAAPWARTILRDGAGIPGALTPASTRLANATVPPGIHEFVLRGASLTGAARAVASWRPAFYTY